ncbi:MAG: signal peptidase II, partial [Actinomycetota bacterium]|nr:signal peptidase II [Actinomycetota bacterium]
NGGVVDFIDFQWWPIFNVADMALVLGLPALLIVKLREQEDHHD